MMAFSPSSSRRPFGVSHIMRSHFGIFAGEAPAFEQQVCIARPIEDYVSIYPIKKCRSHTSITQTTESNLDVEKSCGYVVTSAPENAFCVIDTDEDSGCCGKGVSDEDVGCCCQAAVPPHLHTSATSSTAMSSMSGACSPSLLEPAATKGESAMRTRAPLPSDSAARILAARILAKRGAQAAARAGSGDGTDEDDDEDEHASVDRFGGGGLNGSDLMGAFCVLTTDQWAALHSAVSDGNQDCDATGSTAPASPPARATATCDAAAVSVSPKASHRPTAEQRPQDHQGVPMQVADRDGSPVPSATQSEYPRALSRLGPAPPSEVGGASRGGSAGHDSSSSSRQPAANGSSQGTERASPGGSASSIASLWAAVNGKATSDVYDSTDDTALSVRHRSGLLGLSARLGTAPVVAPSATLEAPRIANRSTVGHHHTHTSFPQAEAPFQAARQTYHAGGVEDGKIGGGGVSFDDGPDSPVGVTARSASCFAGSHFGLARDQLLQGYYSFQPGLSYTEGAATEQLERVRSQSRNSIDLVYHHHHQPVYQPLQPYHPAIQPQHQHQHHTALALGVPGVMSQQHQIHYAQQQQHHLLQGQRQQQYQHHPSYLHLHHHQQPHQLDSSSRRRNSQLMTIPGRALATYTTYGYRRARSSLAALEQTLPHGSGGTGGDGDDDDDNGTEEVPPRIPAPFRTHTGMTRPSGSGLLGPDTAPTTPTGEATAGRRDPWTGVGSGGRLLAAAGADRGGEGACGAESGIDKDATADGEDGPGGPLTRKRSSYHLTNSHAAVELFLRLNHARQTMDFVKRQTLLFANLDKAELSVWEALHLMDELREYEAVLMAEGPKEVQEVSDLSLLEHAFQTAELCRLHHPDQDWLHLVGLIHGLGKLLAHRKFGSQPQWAICGETYPLGCRFSPHILGSQYFTANPDRRRRLYNTPTGLYGPGCGLLNVVMSWSAPEYLYLVLMLNNAAMPQDAVWILRHCKFLTLARPHSCYLPLCSFEDLRRLPLLRSFQSLASPYRCRASELPEGFALQGEERTDYYSTLIAKYIGEGKLRW